MWRPASPITRTLLLGSLALGVPGGLGAQVSPPAAGSPHADPASPGSITIPIALEKGTPLSIALNEPVGIRSGEPVEGVLLQPIYSFDREEVPAGSKVLGRIAAVKNASRMQRSQAIMRGDFSPLRTAEVEFDTLVPPDGRRLPIETSVSPGAPQVVHLETADQGKKPGAVSSAVASAKQQVYTEKQEIMTAVKQPRRLHRLKEMLISELPYHRPRLAAGTRYSAELTSSVALGSMQVPAAELRSVGQTPPAGSLLQAALLTPLSSATAQRGTPVKAIVTRPLFSDDHQLIVPEGSMLEGMVVQAKPAERLKLHRGGLLRFTFNRIETPDRIGTPHETAHPVAASLAAVDVDKQERVKLDSEGGAHSTTSKMDYTAPAIAVLIAATAAQSDVDVRPGGRVYSDTQGPASGQILGGGLGYRLVGAVLALGVQYRPVTAALAAYGAAWSVYSHLLSRGQEITFPEDTPMQIRFGEQHARPAAPSTPAAPAKPGA